MRQISSSKRLAAPLALLLAVPIGLGAVFAAPMLKRTDPPLQRIADEAALASVNALAATKPLSATRRNSVSTAAALRVVGEHRATLRSVQPADHDLAVSVELTDPATHASATATARYVPPSEGRAEQNAAAISQHRGPPVRL